MLDDPEKNFREIKKSPIVISSKYRWHMLARLIKIIYRVCKL
jgi:predicted ATP-dependent Lon-type protease